jgi:hypothetical protein
VGIERSSTALPLALANPGRPNHRAVCDGWDAYTQPATLFVFVFAFAVMPQSQTSHLLDKPASKYLKKIFQKVGMFLARPKTVINRPRFTTNPPQPHHENTPQKRHIFQNHP